MAELSFVGPFTKEMEDFILTKRALGLKYETEARQLAAFGRFLGDRFPNATALTEEMIMEWCQQSTWETLRNRYARASIARQFSIFLSDLGQDAWILPSQFYPKGPKYVPHIYTRDELKRFFDATDACSYCSQVPFRHLVMPEYFRLLLSCGLRCSEGRLLKRDHVDLDDGVLTILDSKNGNDRLVPLTATIRDRLRAYTDKVHSGFSETEWFFPGRGGEPMTINNVYCNFRRFLWKAGISHTGRGPRVHDFRHTFCVYRLKEWASSGGDILSLLPIMRVYLGHKTLADTAYYLQWTADVFPEIRSQLEDSYAHIIPTLRGENS